ncbi:Rho protein GDP-dissociation inhibitor [Dillenia turbinata]|uniref:Rho protein GDP-dissociation inhibitor n=1 Tax=Dillenia turbinata TaxID=194707 RepID=A0AAN8YWM8_9MAGN
MGFDDKGEEVVVGVEGNEKEDKVDECETVTKIPRNMSGSSLYTTEEDDDDDEEIEGKLQLGPQFTLKEQLEKDKDNESLRRWKEQLLGIVDVNSIRG